MTMALAHPARSRTSFLRRAAAIGVGVTLAASLVSLPTAAQAAVPPGGGVVTPPTSYVLAVPASLQKQSNGYYCAPAAVRAALQFDGVASPPSQATIAGEIGTTTKGTDFTTKIPNSLNSRQNKNDYVLVSSGTNLTQTDLIARMKRTIGILKTAAVVGGTPYGTLPWWSSTDPSPPTGHAVTVYGYSTTSVNIFDPLTGTKHTATYAQFTKFVNSATQTGGVNYDDEIVY